MGLGPIKIGSQHAVINGVIHGPKVSKDMDGIVIPKSKGGAT